MSPLNKKKLNLIRKKLDKLDNNLIKIIKKRTFLVKKVLMRMSGTSLIRVLQIFIMLFQFTILFGIHVFA